MPKSKGKLRIGLLGAGSIATLHAKAYAALGIQVAAVADISPDALNRIGQIHPQARRVSSWQEVVESPDVDIVDISLVSSLHLPAMRLAVTVDKPIFCEKTMCASRAEAEEALAMLRYYPRPVQIGYMKRFLPATRKAVEWMKEIGEPIGARIRSFQGGKFSHDVYDDPMWKPQGGRPSTVRTFASGGMLMMAGSHMLDLMHLFLGLPQSVSATMWKPEAYDADLFSTALFQFKNGATAILEAGQPPFSTLGHFGDGWDEFVSIDGREGRLEIYYMRWNAPESAAPYLRIYRRSTQRWEEYSSPITNPFATELDAFLTNVSDQRVVGPGPFEGYVVDLLIDACETSARLNKNQVLTYAEPQAFVASS